MKKLTKEIFVKKSEQIHGERYIYDRVIYHNSKSKVEIICKKHGVFIQTADDHLSKCGCPKCGRSSAAKKLASSFEDIIDRLIKQHGEKYDYRLVDLKNFKGFKDEIEIICPDHGSFRMLVGNHYNGQGCRKCSLKNSCLENSLKSFFDKNKIYAENGCRSIIGALEVDFYLPEFNLAIECNGEYWHSEGKGRGEFYHLNKLNLCKEKDIDLIQFWGGEIINKFDIVSNVLLSRLGLLPRKLSLEKSYLKELSEEEKKTFLEKNHLLGDVKSSINLGLFVEDELVFVACFNENTEEMKLMRFASLLNVSIKGAFFRVVSFVQENFPKRVTALCDKRLFNGEFFKENGFKLISEEDPDYFWFFQSKPEDLYSKSKMEKDEIYKNLLNFDPKSSEWENMKRNKWNRVWDCGNYKFAKEPLQ